PFHQGGDRLPGRAAGRYGLLPHLSKARPAYRSSAPKTWAPRTGGFNNLLAVGRIMVTIAVATQPPDEPRVAVSPETVKKLVGLGAHVKVEAGAGARSRFSDEMLRAQGAEIVPTAADALRDADVLLSVRRPAAANVQALKPGALVIAMLDP